MNDREILKLFAEDKNTSLRMEEVALRLGIDRSEAESAIGRMTESGARFALEADGRMSLRCPPDAVDEWVFRMDRQPGSFGSAVRCMDTVDSTNREAKVWAESGAPHGAAVIADTQTEGRGRKGRSWVSGGGKGLWMSVVLRPQMQATQVQPVTLLAAVAVSRAVEDLTGRIPQIKWPNDLWLGGRKLCGILTELSADMQGVRWVVIGIGVNMHMKAEDFPEELRSIATSLCIETGNRYRRTDLAARILFYLEHYMDRWQAEGFSAVAAVYRERMALLGKKIHMIDGNRTRDGVIIGVDDAGALLLEIDGNVTPVITGEVTVRAAES